MHVIKPPVERAIVCRKSNIHYGFESFPPGSDLVTRRGLVHLRHPIAAMPEDGSVTRVLLF